MNLSCFPESETGVFIARRKSLPKYGGWLKVETALIKLRILSWQEPFTRHKMPLSVCLTYRYDMSIAVKPLVERL